VWHYFYNGFWPQVLQPQNYLYRKGYYGLQANFNMNPDNHFDANGNCWTTDPMCGVDIGPKRPWEDLREPEKVLFKLRRDASTDLRYKVNGFRG